jgi:hypothetical protein
MYYYSVPLVKMAGETTLFHKTVNAYLRLTTLVGTGRLS